MSILFIFLFFSPAQELCKELNRKIDIVDDTRYDLEVKIVKNEKEVQHNSITRSYKYSSCTHWPSSVLFLFDAQIESLSQKITELKGVKRPNLKRVKKSADDMLGAYTETSKLMKPDFKVNLKTVKKEEDKVKLKSTVDKKVHWKDDIC